ncbi:MAG: hypothetical protein ABSF50_08925 [Burkholderiaceae bacterium]|jgi:hypothetical protein
MGNNFCLACGAALMPDDPWCRRCWAEASVGGVTIPQATSLPSLFGLWTARISGVWPGRATEPFRKV